MAESKGLNWPKHLPPVLYPDSLQHNEDALLSLEPSTTSVTSSQQSLILQSNSALALGQHGGMRSEEGNSLSSSEWEEGTSTPSLQNIANDDIQLLVRSVS